MTSQYLLATGAKGIEIVRNKQGKPGDVKLKWSPIYQNLGSQKYPTVMSSPYSQVAEDKISYIIMAATTEEAI